MNEPNGSGNEYKLTTQKLVLNSVYARKLTTGIEI